MGTRSTSCTRRAGARFARLTLSPSGYYRGDRKSKERLFDRSKSELDPDLADRFPATVLQWDNREARELELELAEEGSGGRPEAAAVAVVCLQRDADPVSGGAEEALGTPLRDPA